MNECWPDEFPQEAIRLIENGEERITQLEAENERLNGLVDIENTYGHLYLVAMRYIKNEWGEDKYWELFEAVCEHFDTLLTVEEQDDE